MKLFLSSFRLGDDPQKLSDLFLRNKKVAVIANAVDHATDAERDERVTYEMNALRSIGLEPEELDLRKYFLDNSALATDVSKFGGVWLRGGNSFVLRKAMAYSGFDAYVLSMKANPDFVYAGYSAGVCVCGPTLHGVELCDDPHALPIDYHPEIIWEGLGLISYSVAPHYRSDHPESALIEQVVEYYQQNHIPYVPLADGEFITTSV